MRIDELADQHANICILGFGREGQAVLNALEHHAKDATIVIADAKPDLRNEKCPCICGPGYLEEMDKKNFRWIIKSPGIPPNPFIEKWRSEGRLTSSTQLFLDTAKAKGSTVIGITGSKGKSTTTSLIYAILAAAGKDVHLAGNIGIPSIDFIDKAKANTVFVLEMSSYQLMDLTTSPDIAVITSFFPEHLDYHGSLSAYTEAKRHITRFQGKQDAVFYNESFPETKRIAEESPGTKIEFSAKDSPVTLAEIKLLGEHNLGNIAGAFAVSTYMKIPENIALPVIRNFAGLPHRLQSIGIHDDIEWIDDSISTTPESAVAGLKALRARVQTMIVGGQDRGYDFSILIQELQQSENIHHVILLPGSGTAIRKTAEKMNLKTMLHTAADMQDAVRIAKEVTEKGRACLLSPASPSYGYYKNFEERGAKFKQAVEI